MAGLGYKDFTAGAVLTAAQVDGYLMEQAVMNFAGTAARGAALSSIQSAGMVAHVGGGTLTVYDGSNWVQVYPAAATGLTFIAGTAFTGGSVISFNNCFTSTYDAYRVLIRSTSSAANSLAIRMRLSGTDATSAVYQSQRLTGGGATAAAVQALNQTSVAVHAQDLNTQNASSIDIFNPATSDPTLFLSYNVRDGATSPNVFNYVGGHNAGTAYDGFSLITVTAGTSTGTVRIYGYGKG